MPRRRRASLSTKGNAVAEDFDQRFGDLLRDLASARALSRGAAEVDDADVRAAWQDLLAAGTRPTFWTVAPDFGFAAGGAVASAGAGVFACGGAAGLGWLLLSAGALVAAFAALLRYRPPA